MQDLVDDLAGAQLAPEPRLAGRAERAVHGAAGLRADADRRPLVGPPARRVAHEHRLDPLAIAQLVDRLGGQAAIGTDDVAVGDRREPELGGDGRSQRRRQVRQVIERSGAGPMRALEHLSGPIRGLAAGVEPRGELGRVDLADRRPWTGDR